MVIAVAGKKYLTRGGWVTLRARDVAAAEAALTEVPGEVARLLGGGAVRCRPEVAAALARWRELLWEAVQEDAAARGLPPFKGLIIVTSAYRPWGTSCALGTAFADPAGALDSQDDFGHWSGWAVDVPTRFTRESFFPIPKVAVCWRAAARAGLTRPFADEYWHWRPRDVFALTARQADVKP